MDHPLPLDERDDPLHDSSEPPLAAPAPEFVIAPALRMLADQTSAVAESVRALRTNLIAKHLQDGRRALAICSPTVGSGCSFLAANLAAAMAQAGVNTLLIDGNLRAPAVADYVVPSIAVPGLAELLADPGLALGKVVQYVQPSLSVLYAGDATGAAVGLLGGSRFKDLIGLCLRDYDLTIVDTPPSSEFADARRIASVVRYAIVVACRGRTYLRDLRTLVGELEADQAQPIGTYLNDY